MGFLYLFLSILGESSGKTIDKFNFRRNRVNPRQLLFIVFYTMTASIFGFIILTKQTFPHISLITLALLIGIAIFSFGGNVFDCLSLKADDLSLREPLVDFEPILTGFLGYLIFPAERKTAFLVAFILGALIVRWGIHRRKLRKFQSKGIYYLWIGVLLYAIVPIFYKEALVHLSPTYIAFFRVSSILLLTSIFFPPKSCLLYTSYLCSDICTLHHRFAGFCCLERCSHRN